MAGGSSLAGNMILVGEGVNDGKSIEGGTLGVLLSSNLGVFGLKSPLGGVASEIGSTLGS